MTNEPSKKSLKEARVVIFGREEYTVTNNEMEEMVYKIARALDKAYHDGQESVSGVDALKKKSQERNGMSDEDLRMLNRYMGGH